jgi:hypothetical protein
MSLFRGVCVTYQTSFGLHLLHLIHSHRSGLQVIKGYLWFTHFTVHRCIRNRFLSLHELYPGNGFIAVSLALQITRGVFCARPNSILTLILRLPIPETRLHSIPSSCPGRLASRSSALHFWLGSVFTTSSRLLTMSFYNPSTWTTRKTQTLFLRRRVYWPVT